MKLNKIESFVILAERLNFKQAAQDLGVTSAVLKARVASLENELGTNLICKEKEQIILTAAGNLFLKDARDLLDDYQIAKERIHETQNLPDKRLNIAIVGTGMPPRIGTVLRLMAQQFPSIDLRLFDDSNYDSLTSIRSGEIDAYFCYLTSPSHLPKDIEVKNLFTVPMCALLPRNHHLAHETTLSLKQLEGETFYLYPPLADRSLHDAEEAILQNSDSRYKVKTTFSKTFYKVAVGTGLGISLCPWVLKDHIPHSVIAIPLVDDCALTLYLLYSRDHDSPLLKTFLELIQTMKF